MDFPSIIKEAWRVTWRYKTLWVLGLFAGTVGGTWGTSSYRADSQQVSQWTSPSAAWAEFTSFMHDWAPALIAAAVALVLIGILWLVLSVAAQAGLVWEVDAAERGGAVSASEGWNAGFHRWWKVLGVGAVLILPILLFGLLVLVLAGVSLVSAFGSISAEGARAASGWAALAGLVVLGIVSLPVFIVLSFVLGNMYVLALRYLVLEGRPVMDSIRAAWQSLRHRFKDVFLMWLITIGLAIAFGIALAIPAGVVGAGIAVTGMLGAWPIAAVFGLLLFVVLLVVAAAWNTFTSALWTIFFRRLTGRDAAQVRPVAPTYPPYPAPTAPPGYAPVGPPIGGGYGPAPQQPASPWPSAPPPPPGSPPAPPSPPTPTEPPDADAPGVGPR